MSGISRKYVWHMNSESFLVYVWYISELSFPSHLGLCLVYTRHMTLSANRPAAAMRLGCAAAAHVFWVSRVFIVQRQRWLATTGGGNARAATDAAQCAQHHWHDQLRWFQCRSSSNHRKISRWCTHRTCTVLSQEVKSNPKANSKIQPPKVRSARSSDRNRLALNFQMQSLQNWNQQREYKPWNWQPEDN